MKPFQHCASIGTPIMFIHGDRDYIISRRHSERMADAVKAKKELVIIRSAPHQLPASEYKQDVFGHVYGGLLKISL